MSFRTKVIATDIVSTANKLAGIRRIERRDIPDLCDLFADIFRSGRKLRRDELAACFEQTYLSSPGDRVRPASLVDVGPDGRIKGFMGIITVSARLNGALLRGGILGNFMACEADRAKIALRLTRATVQHELDFTFTDTANTLSLGIARAVRYQTLPLQGLEWVKVLRPCETASFLLGRRTPMFGAVLKPIAKATDLVARHLPFAAVPDQAREAVVDRAIDPDVFAQRAPALVARFRLRPDWNTDELTWLLGQAKGKIHNGTLRLREVAARDGKTLGLYLLYARPGGVAHALQVLALRHREDAVLTSLIRHAHEIGAVAVRGAASPDIVEGLMRHPGIVYHHVMACTVFTKRPDLAEAFRSNDVLIGGLMGESWTRLVADAFI